MNTSQLNGNGHLAQDPLNDWDDHISVEMPTSIGKPLVSTGGRIKRNWKPRKAATPAIPDPQRNLTLAPLNDQEDALCDPAEIPWNKTQACKRLKKCYAWWTPIWLLRSIVDPLLAHVLAHILFLFRNRKDYASNHQETIAEDESIDSDNPLLRIHCRSKNKAPRNLPMARRFTKSGYRFFAYTSLTKMAARLRMDRRTLSRCLAKLEKEGWIGYQAPSENKSGKVRFFPIFKRVAAAFQSQYPNDITKAELAHGVLDENGNKRSLRNRRVYNKHARCLEGPEVPLHHGWGESQTSRLAMNCRRGLFVYYVDTYSMKVQAGVRVTTKVWDACQGHAGRAYLLSQVLALLVQIPVGVAACGHYCWPVSLGVERFVC